MTQPAPEYQKEIERSRKALLAADELLAASLLEDAVSRSYYSVLHAAKAMLLLRGVRVSSHEAVKRLFGLHFAKTGEVDAKYAEILRWQQDDRMLADYDVGYEPHIDQVRGRVNDAHAFVEMAASLIQRAGH